jgi:predicted transcriptional regulator
MVHKGEIIKAAIESSGMNITEVARRINVQRPTMYGYFSNPHVSLDVILQIGKVINYDFTPEIPELKAIVKAHMLQEPEGEYKSKLHECREELLSLSMKYSGVLERVAQLLDDNQKLKNQLGLK